MEYRRNFVWCGVLAWLATACGTTAAGPGPDSPTLAKAAVNGDGQVAQSGTPLPQPLVVTATLNGNPVGDVKVTWALLAGAGSVAPVSTRTGSDGTASTNVTLPPFAANLTVVATATGLNGSPVLFSVGSSGATTTATFRVVDNEFQPQDITLKAGGTATFTWGTNSGSHNVTAVAPNTAPASPNPPPPATHRFPFSFSASFPTPGSYAFFCGVHGAPGTGMHGTLTVIP